MDATAKFSISIGMVLGIGGLVPWLLEERGYHMPEGLVLWCGLLAMVALAGCAYYPFYPRLIPAATIAFIAGLAVSWWWIGPEQSENRNKQAMRDEWKAYKYTEVWDKTFQDETVPIDGYHYRRCKFINVTFTYNGAAPAKISESYQEGTRHLDTNNPIVQSAIRSFLALDDQGRKMAPNMTTAGRPLKPWEE